ncbi:MAG TPA: PKD domain-containing protein [Candidatus Nanoarchaeia archaeon]|nr:PKD domain-containing protein [Candidatus Nanoarchaeia archaeon]
MKTASSVGVVLLLLVSVAAASFTFDYSEGELVRLVPEGQDDDEDILTFEYGEPLNASGEWQTSFEDAGTYETFIRANDGTSVTEKEVTLVIKNVNRPPLLKLSDISIDEGDIVTVNPDVEDFDGDAVTVEFDSPLNAEGTWQTNFGDAGQHIIKIFARDAESTVEGKVNITVLKKNQPPRIVSALPQSKELSVRESDDLTFHVVARDPEEQQLNVTWTVDDVEMYSGDAFVYSLDYESSGTHDVVALVSDGIDTTEEIWVVDVSNVNRPPVLELSEIQSKENEPIVLNFSETDDDGDEITYTFSDLFSSDGVWTPSFEDAGVHTVVVAASDGEFVTNGTLKLVVENVDRAPEFAPVEQQSLFETETLSVDVSVADPDGDELAFDFVGPSDAMFASDEIVWTPGYDTVSKPKGFLLKLLQFFALDNYFYPAEKDFPFVLTACGAEKCTTLKFDVLVKGKNRPPLIEEISSVEAREGDVIAFAPVVSDPDNDRVRVTVGEPVGKRWITNFESAGDYTVVVTADDGTEATELRVPLTVRNVNQAPTFSAVGDQVIAEGDELSFSLDVEDSDGDDVVLIAEDLPDGASFDDGTFRWTPDFDATTKDDKRSTYLVTFSASDSQSVSPSDIINDTESNDTTAVVEALSEPVTSQSTVQKTVQITVTDKNRAPQFADVIPASRIRATVGEPIAFKAVALDPDGDELEYTWDFGLFDSVESSKGVRRRFSEPGDKKIMLTVSDGQVSVEHEWIVRVSSRQRTTNSTRVAETKLEAK